MPTNILDMIQRATELVDEGLKLYEQTKEQVSNVAADIDADTLQEAQAALAAALNRANAAHDSLDAAISRALAEKQ